VLALGLQLGFGFTFWQCLFCRQDASSNRFGRNKANTKI